MTVSGSERGAILRRVLRLRKPSFLNLTAGEFTRPLGQIGTVTKTPRLIEKPI